MRFIPLQKKKNGKERNNNIKNKFSSFIPKNKN